MRTIRYERRAGEDDPLPGQQRMGAHTDYGIVTVLYAEPVAGLQIVGPDGDWIDVIPADDALVINLGDLTAQWTNDQWRSTVHRVVPPPTTVAAPAVRRSAAFFLDGNWDALIECLPTCCSAIEPAALSTGHRRRSSDRQADGTAAAAAERRRRHVRRPGYRVTHDASTFAGWTSPSPIAATSTGRLCWSSWTSASIPTRPCFTSSWSPAETRTITRR